MRRISWGAIIVAATGLGALGCEAETTGPEVTISGETVTEVIPGDEPVSGDGGSGEAVAAEPEPGAPVTSALSPTTCNASPYWWSNDDAGGFFVPGLYGPATVEFSPDGKFAIGLGAFSGSVIHTEGAVEPGHSGKSIGPDGIDASWQYYFRHQPWGGKLELVRFFDDEPVTEVDTTWAPVEGQYLASYGGALLQPGTPFDVLGAGIGCWAEPSAAAVYTPRLYRLIDGAYEYPRFVETAVELPAEVCVSEAYLAQNELPRTFRAVPDSTAVVFASAGAGALYWLDLQTEELRAVALNLGPAKPVELWGSATAAAYIVDLEISPDGQLIVVVGTDGLGRTYALPALEPVGEPFDVGIRVANTNSYLPSVESPVAFSPDGRTLVHSAPSGDLSVRTWSEETGAWSAPATLDAQSLPMASGFNGLGGDEANRALSAVGFSPDGTVLAAYFDDGVALWGCESALEPLAPLPVAPVELTIVPPGEHPTSVHALYQLSIANAVSPVALTQWTLDGQTHTGWFMGTNQQFWFDEPGTHTLGVTYRDGVNEATAELVIEVQ